MSGPEMQEVESSLHIPSFEDVDDKKLDELLTAVNSGQYRRGVFIFDSRNSDEQALASRMRERLKALHISEGLELTPFTSIGPQGENRAACSAEKKKPPMFVAQRNLEYRRPAHRRGGRRR